MRRTKQKSSPTKPFSQKGRTIPQQPPRGGQQRQEGRQRYLRGKCRLLLLIQVILVGIVMFAVVFEITRSKEGYIDKSNLAGDRTRYNHDKQNREKDVNFMTNTTTNGINEKIEFNQSSIRSIKMKDFDAKKITGIHTNLIDVKEEMDDRKPCRVIIENKVDFHHEILESIVLRYPLPWENYNCSATKPIMFDFALFDNRFPNGMITCPEKKCPKHLNETEFVGWKRYFEGYLQNRTFHRVVDGRKVQYNKLIKYVEYENSPLGPPDAVIDATCDIYQRFLVWLTHGTYDNYCVLHRACEFCEQVHYNKSCFLTPMWPKSQCTFLPSDLPRFHEEDLRKQESDDPLQTAVCLFGRERNHSLWANVFLQSPYKKYNVKFVIGSRVYSVKRVYKTSDILSKALSFVDHERDYVEFSKRIAQCDILLPATDPIDRPAHFPPSISGKKSKRKLTGSISQVVGYKLHSVMHYELERIYHDYFTAPVEVYGDTIQSKVDALTKMIATVSQNKRLRNGNMS